MKIIIYATHSFGTYETLIKHPDVICIGFGTKWEGFVQKAETVCHYLNDLPDDEIVAVIDGFDSYIKKTKDIENEFLKKNCKVLVSLHNTWFNFEYLEKKVFSSCKKNKTANSGLIMGYAKEMKEVWNSMKNGPSSDDQRNLNLACEKIPYIKVDAECTIFENCNNLNHVQKSNAYICQIPGDVSLQRFIRSIFEYSRYFIFEIMIIVLILFLFIQSKRPNFMKMKSRTKS
jgi:hypothetical protein